MENKCYIKKEDIGMPHSVEQVVGVERCIVCAYGNGYYHKRLPDNKIYCPNPYDLDWFECPVANKNIGNGSRKRFRKYLEKLLPKEIKQKAQELSDNIFKLSLYGYSSVEILDHLLKEEKSRIRRENRRNSK